MTAGKENILTEDQQCAVAWADGELLVGAAAGGGKTLVLVERFVHLVCERGVSAENIPALTFTEKAAAQLKRRIRGKLELLPDCSIHIRKLDSGYISTIHGFCRKLLRENFHLANLDPSFLVIPGEEAKLLKIRAVDDLLDDIFIGTEGDELLEGLTGLCVEYGGAGFDVTVKKMILELYSWLMRQTDPWEILKELEQRSETFSDDNPLTEFFHAMLAERVEAFIKDARSLQPWDSDVDAKGKPKKYAEAIREMLSRVFELEKLDPRTEFGETQKIVSAIKLPARRGKLDPELNGTLIRLKNVSHKRLDEIIESIGADADAESRAAWKYTGTLARLTRLFAERYIRLKERRWGLDFDDLQHRLLQLLREHPEASEKYRERFKHLLIDEYQDNNQVQDAIIRHVCDESGLFMVGDSKQSIYRFRGAEPKVFTRTEQRLRADKAKDQTIWLKSNFRSAKGICDGINQLLGPLFSGGNSEIDYSQGHALEAKRDPVERDDPSMEIVILDASAKEKSDDRESDERNDREREADYVAGRIHEMATSTGTKVSHGDIVILLRSKKESATVFASALRRAGIPYHFPAAGGLLDAQEIRDIRNLLMVIDNPLQDIPLAAVLVSPIVGMKPDELYEIRLAYPEDENYFELINSAADDKSLDQNTRLKITGFLSMLNDFRKLETLVTPVELINAIYRETSYREYAMGLEDSVTSGENLDSFVDLAKQAVPAGEGGIRQFIQFLKEIEEGTTEPSMDKPGESADTVRIMTIHAAKGLEFPVVFVSDLGRQFSGESMKGDFVLDDEHGPVMQFSDAANGIQRATRESFAAKERIRTRERAEELRILYVALTRAMEKLILTGTFKLEKLGDLLDSSDDPGMDPKARTPMHWLLPILTPMHRLLQDTDEMAGSEGFIVSPKDDGWQLAEVQESAVVPPEIVEPEPDELLDKISSCTPLDDISPKIPGRFKPLFKKYGFPWAIDLRDKISAGGLKLSTYDIGVDGVGDDTAVEWEERVSDPREEGIILHEAFENIEFDGISETGWSMREAERISRASKLPEDWNAEKLAAAIEGLKSQRFDAHFADADEIWVEKAFFLKIHFAEILKHEQFVPDQDDWIMLQGRMDLVIIRNKTAYLVDYKSDSIPADKFADRAIGYTHQMAAYSRALKDIRGFDVRCFIYFIRHSKYFEMTDLVNDFDLPGEVLNSVHSGTFTE